MILKNVSYIDKNYRLSKNDFLIQNGIIEKIGTLIDGDEHSEQTIDMSDYIIIPGLANAHIHTPDTLTRGIFKDCKLSDWCLDTDQGKIQQEIFKYIDESVNSEDFETIALYSYVQHIKQGITFIVESGQADLSAASLERCIKKVGIKALLDIYDEYEFLKKNEYMEYGTHFPEEEDITDEEIEKVKEINAKYEPYIMTHCLETESRKKEVYSKYNESTIELLKRNDLLSGKTILFHCVHLNEKDIKIIAENKSNIVYCPVSNMWSNAGDAPIEKILENNINVMIATDFIYNDFWEVMRMAYYKIKSSDTENKYSINDVFKMATENAEKIKGKTEYSGVIAEGKSADLVFIKVDNNLQPIIEIPKFSNVLHNIIAHLEKSMIEHVMISGKFIMKNKKMQTIDEKEVNRRYKEICDRFIENLR